MTASKDILIVTGTFNENSGKLSYFGKKISDAFIEKFNDTVYFINGGNLDQLNASYSSVTDYKVILWMPNIDNSVDKYLQDIKIKNKTAILIQSKRNDHNKYSTFQIVERMFKAHSNLCLEISKHGDSIYKFRLLDPLGNMWYIGSDIAEVSRIIVKIVDKLRSYHRYPSIISSSFESSIDIDPCFIEAVKFCGWRFSQLINSAISNERFLGNASTRCMKGFPSIRKDDTIYVSKRNTNKELISSDDFIPVSIDNKKVLYGGPYKPSVDAAVQIMLFKYYTNVNYIIHGHVYVYGNDFTEKYIPCGYIEEYAEIVNIRKNSLSYNFSVNLIGHGCIILARDLNYFAGIGMYERPFPEELKSITFE